MNRVAEALAFLILTFLGRWEIWQGIAVGDSPDKSCIAVLPFISLSAGGGAYRCWRWHDRGADC
jgi:hypothetical protein